ncbi:MAG: hydrogenase expression/formation protein HypE [Deltaproteobacteria bacterium]|nr:hydrogenase expression/formation protein HypE [Deltaproteobacteria bacterium]
MITLAHGAGGRLTRRLVEEHFLPRLQNPALAALGDSAIVGDLALTTDSYVVTPRFFPGGDIGRLAVCGTVNDLVVAGAEPVGLTAGFVLEEGLALDELDRVVESMAAAAEEAGVSVVAGDTKVVQRGACDGLFVNTAGVGRVAPGFGPAPDGARAGDVVLLNGTIGDHGMAVLACREGLPIEGDLTSDVAPLCGMVRALRDANIDVHAMRDPTRGGLAGALIELAQASNQRVVIEERAIPLRPSVRAACELTGIDPLHVANEGKLIAIVPADQAAAALEILRADTLGASAAIIGRVEEGDPGLEMMTTLGGRRGVQMPLGEILPRIC